MGEAHGKSARGRKGPGSYPRRLSPEAVAEIKALYRGGATARALAERFGGSERRLYRHLGAAGCLRKQQPEAACALDAAEVAGAVRGTRGCAADAACRGLGAEASLGEAARAAAATAINMLREAEPARAYAYARLAGTLERLARGAAGDGARGGERGGERDADGMERGRRAALDFLRREAVEPAREGGAVE
jgi:hypothetical protein